MMSELSTTRYESTKTSTVMKAWKISTAVKLVATLHCVATKLYNHNFNARTK